MKQIFHIFLIFIFTFVVNGQQHFQDTDRQIERFNLAKSVYFNYDIHTFTTEHPDSFHMPCADLKMGNISMERTAMLPILNPRQGSGAEPLC